MHFRLTGWESFYEKEPNDRAPQANPVRAGLSINGVIENVDDSDWYKIHAQAGETLAFNVLMGRNGYAAVGERGHFTLTLLSPRGVPIATGFGRFLMDPYLQHRFSVEGDYYLVINHSRMAVTCLENECDHRRLWEPYQLTIGRSPVLWSLWPNIARPGSKLKARLKADFLDAGTPLLFSDPNISAKLGDADNDGHSVVIEVGKQAKPGTHLLRVPDPSGTANALSFRVEAGGLQIESEPNDTRDASIPFDGPVTYAGRIDRPGDIDSFFFIPAGTEGFAFHLDARNAGSSLVDPNLSITCKEGDLAVSNDDAPSFRNPRNRDPFLEFKAADAPNCMDREQGFYLQIRDWSKHSGDSSFYWFHIEKQEPRFIAGLRQDRFTLERGKITKIPVQIQRLGGFSADVTVTASDVPAGVSAKPLVIPSGKSSGEMEWLAGSSEPISPFPLRLSASAELGGQKIAQPVVAPQPILGDGPGYVQIDETEAWMAVAAPVQFALDRVPPPGAGFGLDRHLLAMRTDRRARVLVRVERAPDCSEPLTFEPEGLPAGVTIESQRPAEEGKAVEVILKANQDNIPGGEYRITLAASMTKGNERVSEALKPFYLRVEH